MFKLTFPNGESAIKEKLDFIRIHKENCFILCSREQADGVVYKGCPFLFSEGTHVHEVDIGDIYMTIEEMAAAIREGVNEV